jgi:hypothetical protein
MESTPRGSSSLEFKNLQPVTLASVFEDCVVVHAKRADSKRYKLPADGEDEHDAHTLDYAKAATLTRALTAIDKSGAKGIWEQMQRYQQPKGTNANARNHAQAFLQQAETLWTPLAEQAQVERMEQEV